jgi:hypothetical protein
MAQKFPTKFNGVIAAKICEGIQAGYTRTAVCHKVGIGPGTLRSWLKKGDESSSHRMLIDFRCSFDKAENEATVYLMDTIKFHSKKDWKAAAWLLERTRNGFKLRSRMSEEAQRRIDDLAVVKAELELDYIRAKTTAIKGGNISPEQILELLNDSTKKQAEKSVH